MNKKNFFLACTLFCTSLVPIGAKTETTSTIPFECIPFLTNQDTVETSTTSTKKTEIAIPPLPTTIVINEAFPNPVGSDNENEFIEIKNIGSSTVDISGWKLGDASSKRYEISNTTLEARSILVFKRKQTGISLNNSGTEEVKIFDNHNRLVDLVTYSGKVEEGTAYAREGSSAFLWTQKPTPGFENQIVNNNENQTTEEKSINKEGNKTKFVKKDGENTDKIATTTKKIVEETQKEIKKEKTSDSFFADIDLSAYLEISEILPNPFGSDDMEFIEIYNPGSVAINISGLKLDDEEGGSKPYTIPDGTILNAGQVKNFWREDTKIALNNTGDEARLLGADNSIITSVSYKDVIEGATYIKYGLEWVWTDQPTPGEKNRYLPLLSIEEENNIKEANKTIIETTVQNIRDFDKGDHVRVQGVINVLPGILGSQYFYIVDEESSSSTSAGVQVYMYSKEFPELAVGDLVQITGELTESQGESRVKIKTKEDIGVLDSGIEVVAQEIEASQIGESVEGVFVLTGGEVTEVKGSYMYIDDGTDELKVYFKKGADINKSDIKIGDIVQVKGFVSQTKSGHQLLPREQGDIKKVGVVEEVLKQEEEKEKEDQKDVAEKYLTATAGGLTSIVVGLIAKTRGALATNLLKRVRSVITLALGVKK